MTILIEEPCVSVVEVAKRAGRTVDEVKAEAAQLNLFVGVNWAHEEALPARDAYSLVDGSVRRGKAVTSERCGARRCGVEVTVSVRVGPAAWRRVQRGTCPVGEVEVKAASGSCALWRLAAQPPKPTRPGTWGEAAAVFAAGAVW